jgi:hypothetical protein
MRRSGHPAPLGTVYIRSKAGFRALDAPAVNIAWGLRLTGGQCRQGQLVPVSDRLESSQSVREARAAPLARRQLAGENDDPFVAISVPPNGHRAPTVWQRRKSVLELPGDKRQRSAPLRGVSVRLSPALARGSLPSSRGRMPCGGVEVPDLAGGIDQVGVIQLRRDIVFVGLG